MGHPRSASVPETPPIVPVPPIADVPVVIVPAFPAFSPAAIAGLLNIYRSTVQYWLTNGKLDSFQDNIGERYVLRGELVRFIKEYLKRGVQ